jgi:hypothetical protein
MRVYLLIVLGALTFGSAAFAQTKPPDVPELTITVTKATECLPSKRIQREFLVKLHFDAFVAETSEKFDSSHDRGILFEYMVPSEKDSNGMHIVHPYPIN